MQQADIVGVCRDITSDTQVRPLSLTSFAESLTHRLAELRWNSISNGQLPVQPDERSRLMHELDLRYRLQSWIRQDSSADLRHRRYHL